MSFSEVSRNRPSTLEEGSFVHWLIDEPIAAKRQKAPVSYKETLVATSHEVDFIAMKHKLSVTVKETLSIICKFVRRGVTPTVAMIAGHGLRERHARTIKKHLAVINMLGILELGRNDWVRREDGTFVGMARKRIVRDAIDDEHRERRIKSYLEGVAEAVNNRRIKSLVRSLFKPVAPVVNRGADNGTVLPKEDNQGWIDKLLELGVARFISVYGTKCYYEVCEMEVST